MCILFKNWQPTLCNMRRHGIADELPHWGPERAEHEALGEMLEPASPIYSDIDYNMDTDNEDEGERVAHLTDATLTNIIEKSLTSSVIADTDVFGPIQGLTRSRPNKRNRVDIEQ